MVIGPLIALFVIATISLLLVRIGATALMMTGLSWDIANFQACSSFFGVGFTTSESEHVVNHPLRRRIIRDLILSGNVGLTSAMTTAIITFLDIKNSSAVLSTLGILIVGLIVLFLLAKIGLVQTLLDKSIRKGLASMGMVHAADYDLLLKVQSGFCVSELEISADDALAGKMLGDSRPADHGIIVLGITKPDSTFLGAPNRYEKVEPGDTLLVYGSEASIQALHSPSQEGSPKHSATPK